MEAEARAPESEPAVARALVENHRRFLAFLQKRVGSRAEAEDILQAAFVRGLERGDQLRDTESAVAWFYRLLRNAVVDHYRRAGTEARVFAADSDAEAAAYEAELRGEVCACVRELLPALKPEYRDLVERVDLEERSVAEVAAELGLTRNNASVRLHRARAGLKKQLERSCGTCATHGCLDCRCGSRRAGAARTE